MFISLLTCSFSFASLQYIYGTFTLILHCMFTFIRSQFAPPPRLSPLNSGRTAIPSWQISKPEANASSKQLTEEEKLETNQTSMKANNDNEEESEHDATVGDVSLMDSAVERSATDQQSHSAETQKEDTL